MTEKFPDSTQEKLTLKDKREFIKNITPEMIIRQNGVCFNNIRPNNSNFPAFLRAKNIKTGEQATISLEDELPEIVPQTDPIYTQIAAAETRNAALDALDESKKKK